jgi:frataxin-like iron-binding protein CyaY
MHELWLSANLTAWHFARHDGQWLERDSSEPMLDVLSTLFSDKLGMDVRFSL